VNQRPSIDSVLVVPMERDADRASDRELLFGQIVPAVLLVALGERAERNESGVAGAVGPPAVPLGKERLTPPPLQGADEGLGLCCLPGPQARQAQGRRRSRRCRPNATTNESATGAWGAPGGGRHGGGAALPVAPPRQQEAADPSQSQRTNRARDGTCLGAPNLGRPRPDTGTNTRQLCLRYRHRCPDM
jgi:hypothetical protein